jgi:UDP-N-acetylmuramoyl-tripeptide--D-alanyl-D-alanine ligase
MPAFAPELLAAWTGGNWTRLPARAPTGFAIDSRALHAGELFIALETGRRDAHAFLADAAAAGAAGAMVRRADPAAGLAQLRVADTLAALQAAGAAWRRQFSAPLTAVTGSCGKTSTKDLLTRLLGGADTVLGTAGNHNNHIGVPLTLLRLDPQVHRHAVIEAGINRRGEMAVMAGWIQPDAVIVTMIGPAHLAGLGDIAAVAAEKAALAAAARLVCLPRACLRHPPLRALQGRLLVLDDGRQAEVPLPPGCERIPFTTTENDGRPESLLCLGWPGAGPAGHTFALPPMSRGMQANAALALSMALASGVPPELLRQRLAGWRPARRRGELLRHGDQWFYVDCYNANPASLADALEAFVRLLPGPRLYVVAAMGELGPDAAGWHRQAGAALALAAGDRAIFIGDHAADLAAGCLAAGNPPAAIAVLADAAGARGQVENFAGSVFLKGSRVWGLEQLLPAGEVAPC